MFNTSSFLMLRKTVVSEVFERSWVKLYQFALGALGVSVGLLASVPVFFQRVDKIHFSRGKPGVSIYLKECTRVLLKFLSGDPSKVSTIKLRAGLPLILPGPIRKGVLRGDLLCIRVALTLFGFARVIFHEGPIKFHTVTDPSTWGVPKTPLRAKKLQQEISSALKGLKVRPYAKPVEEPTILHRSNRMGPNGHSVLAAHWDALVLKESGLWQSFVDLARALGVPSQVQKVVTLAQLSSEWLKVRPSFSRFTPEHQLVLGRFGVKDEAGGKKRLFAISDYFTQSVCKPLHQYLMEILRQLPMDGTWDQGRASDRVCRWTSDKQNKLFCYDLSAATDRFPAEFTVLVLGNLIGVSAARSWLSLLTDRLYWHKGKSYRYNCGQPMGTLSSWAAFALSHHVVVQMAAHRVGLEGLFKDYCILGDDIVIAQEDVALEYLDLMAWFGVEINQSKSVVGAGIAEFAKRHFYHGHEISGIPGRLLSLAGLHLSGLRVWIDVMLTRGWKFDLASVLSSYLSYTTLGLYERVWRYLLISIAGPSAPFSRQALWGGVGWSAIEDFIRVLLLGSPDLSPATTASGSNNLVIWDGVLFQEIERVFEIRRIRRARASWDRWREALLTTVDSLLKGWIISGQQVPLSDQSVSEVDLRFSRALIENGHPALAVMLCDDTEGVSDLDITDLSRPVVPSDRPVTAVLGVAPSGDMKLLIQAAEATKMGQDILRSIGVTVPLSVEWNEPGAREAISDGLLLEVAQDCEAVRTPGFVPPPPARRRKGRRTQR